MRLSGAAWLAAACTVVACAAAAGPALAEPDALAEPESSRLRALGTNKKRVEAAVLAGKDQTAISRLGMPRNESLLRNLSTTKRPATACVPFMGIKLAATGSTWWAEQLNKQRSVDITEEIFTSNSRESARRRQELMLKKLRCGGDAAVKGFTINPKNSPGVHWAAVASSAGVKVVKYTRTNLVKVAVSMIRKKMNICNGKPNVHNVNSSCGEEKKKFDMKDLRSYLLTYATNVWELEAAASAAATVAKVYTMTYEELQMDEYAAMKKLFTFLGRPDLVKPAPKSALLKKTTDDLRDVIINFKEVETFFASLGVAECPLLQMLHATEPAVFLKCDYAKVVDAIKKNQV
ncbi:hypothetical protein M885DRAFT_587979 [Pelagophyceae sp. CCMP2097]|nr:hypothetical protein M885DRAFT_587979 [Pelagophyceae sp. CCMP2097]|mmetsp:Transcript_20789/g.70459  ORF Transcript_20789/g.70459 Transcript_20789/m.70459 type:complete len:348 (-) Transcript_20789:566-1609(-)